MITPAYALTATERVLPRLALDFTTASLDARVTVTRALDTATCVGSDGLIGIVNADLPRFDYDPIALVCKGLLIEESRIQTARATEAISAWSKSSTASTANADTAPDGALTADLIYPTSTGSTRQVYLVNTSAPTSGSVAISVFAKPSGKSWLVIYSLNSSTPVAWFNVSTGVVGTVVAGWTANIEPYANGYYRCVAVGTAVAGQYVTFAIADDDNSVAVTANDTDGIFMWGAQVEAGAFATSYIPNVSTTNGSSVTRNADVATMTGTNFSDWFNATEGTFVLQYVESGNNGTATGLVVNAGALTDRMGMFIDGSGGTPIQPNFVVLSGGALQANILGSAPAANTVAKMAAAYKSNSFIFTLNGAVVGSDAAGSVPTVTQMQIGNQLNGTFANRHIQAIRYYPIRLTNAEVQAFSK